MLIHIMFNIEEIKFQEMNLKNVKGGGKKNIIQNSQMESYLKESYWEKML